MMKSFFKKLAFVMALAMVVTLAAPAAKTAVAAEATAKKPLAIAYQKGAAITALNLAEVGAQEDLRFLYAPENWEELDIVWSSSNPNVVSVDEKTGMVTAEAAGTAKISVAVGTETATIDVYSVDMKTFEATIGTKEERKITEKTIEIGDSFDFAFFGVQDYDMNRYNCQWLLVDPAGVAELDRATGEVTAKAAGTAVLTLVVINKVTLTEIRVADCVIKIPAEEPVATPVPAFEVVNLKAEEEGAAKDLNSTQNTVKLRFAKATEVSLDDIQAWEMFVADDDRTGDGNIDEENLEYEYKTIYVYSVEADDETNKVWTVTMFDDFEDGVKYMIDPDGEGGYKEATFVASVGDVATVEVVELQTALLEKLDLDLREAVLDVELYDAKWVDVTTRVVDGVMNNDPANIYYDVEESLKYSMGYDWVRWVKDLTKANADEGECIFEEHAYMEKDHYHCTVEFYEEAIAAVTAKFECKELSILSDPYNVIPDDQKDYEVEKVVRWTLVEPNGKGTEKADWTKVNHKIPAGELDYTIATLILDSRGNYFTTHKNSATAFGGAQFTDADGVKHDVYWTEDETEDFWSNGYYVKYSAMDPDVMLIEEDGRIETYEESTARYALYLYNYGQEKNDLVKKLYSQVITVCCPKELKNVTTSTNPVTVMTNTQAEGDIENAYWSEFSKGTIKINLNDIHGGAARADHAKAAEFEIKLELNKSKDDMDFDALKDLVEGSDNLANDFYDQLTATDGAERKIEFDATQFTELTKRSQIKFRITEKTTKTYVLVTIILRKPAAMDGDSAQVYPVSEYYDTMEEKVLLTFDNYDAGNGLTVNQKIVKDDKTLNGHAILLKQFDKNSNAIGYDNDLFISNTLDVNDVELDDIAFGEGSNLKVGDRVMFVKGADGKVFAEVGTEVSNPAFNKAEDLQYPMAETTTGLGVRVVKAGTATSASGSPVDYYQYQLVFRAPGDNNELVYAKDGKYQITLRTVKAFEDTDEDGNLEVVFTTSTLLKDTFYATVTNDNTPITVKKRELSRIDATMPYEDAIAGSYLGSEINKYTSVKTGDEQFIKECILEAIDFSWAEKRLEDGTLVEGTADLSTEEILYYTYTVAPTNNQIVINSVCFQVGANTGVNKVDGAAGADGWWYRYETKVNWSLTFED